MRFTVLTLFPEMIEGGMRTSITGRALEQGILALETVNIRDYSANKHNRVDDYPYGGGAGMVMEAEPVYRAHTAACERLGKRPRTIYLTPQAKVLTQKQAKELAAEEDLILLCGHYEGIDERVLEEIVTDYISIGDYVLTGGELPALVLMDVVSRMVKGVLSNEDSGVDESFMNDDEPLLEYPQYTRPAVWHGKEVPAVLLSGHHLNVEKYRREQALLRTGERRPELLPDNIKE
ncbi:MAG: tRNA (guanosine(37)-N1)-methyltransferase TrmD [Lachnospiraceae bacterium]|nr:tRNA (guanosine(37)-N1)-methyltransferase TrmD [Lachnospiraceae bacterium]MDY5742004.1 tRNA (guanosine(37)-N1)-methyltransferase TrmD [Lachnospiraceae bacterium]